MAYITSTIGMDFRDIDWSYIYQGANADFTKHMHYTYSAADYPTQSFDFFTEDEFTSWTDYTGGDYEQIYLNGYGFGFDLSYNPTGGRVQVVALEASLGGVFDYTLLVDVNVSLIGMFAAANTPGLSDDYVITRQALNSDDLILATSELADDYLFGCAGDDEIYGFDGRDTLRGDSGADTLDGGSKSDHLHGGSGNDVLYGGSGADRLKGGAGADLIYGGTDNARDFFRYTAVSDSAVGVDHDIVMDFVSGKDQFDFRAIDADTDTAGDQAFGFAGSTATAHALWYVDDGASVLLQGDVDGDTTADFEILVFGVTSLATGDFLF